jgi:hypothetical protein
MLSKNKSPQNWDLSPRVKKYSPLLSETLSPQNYNKSPQIGIYRPTSKGAKND